MERFGDRIKALRIEKRISQRKLAKELNFYQSSIARCEANEQTPSIDVVVAFAKYFNVTTDYLLCLED